MSVQSILNDKGRSVVTVTPDMDIGEATQVLVDKKIGAAVVLDADETICGIISERDIIKELAKSGEKVSTKLVKDVMTSNVIICSETSSVHEVMELMTNGRFRHVPVEKKGKLIGLISIGDVVRRRIEDAERESEDMKAYISS